MYDEKLKKRNREEKKEEIKRKGKREKNWKYQKNGEAVEKRNNEKTRNGWRKIDFKISLD